MRRIEWVVAALAALALACASDRAVRPDDRGVGGSGRTGQSSEQEGVSIPSGVEQSEDWSGSARDQNTIPPGTGESDPRDMGTGGTGMEGETGVEGETGSDVEGAGVGGSGEPEPGTVHPGESGVGPDDTVVPPSDVGRGGTGVEVQPGEESSEETDSRRRRRTAPDPEAPSTEPGIEPIPGGVP